MSSNDEVNTKFKGKRYAKRPTLKKNFWSKKATLLIEVNLMTKEQVLKTKKII